MPRGAAQPKRRMGRRRFRPLDLKKTTLYLPSEVYSALVEEADRRRLSLGDVVTEALQSRMILLTKAP